MLDKACRYLVDQGFGVLELASLELGESAAMAQQLAAELNIPFRDWLTDAVYCWLQEAREEAKIYKRSHGYFSGELAWKALVRVAEPQAMPSRAPVATSELPPPRGQRNRKLLEEGSTLEAREKNASWASGAASYKKNCY